LFDLKQKSLDQGDESLTEQVFDFIELFHELFSFCSDFGIWQNSKHGGNWQDVEQKDQDFIQKLNTFKNVKQGSKTKTIRYEIQNNLFKKMNEFPKPEENSKLKNQIYLFYFFKKNFLNKLNILVLKLSKI
jgi:hypothetical protein